MLNEKHLLTRHLIMLDSMGNKLKELHQLSKVTVYYVHSFKLCKNNSQKIYAFHITNFECEEEATEFISSLVISEYDDKYTINIL